MSRKRRRSITRLLWRGLWGLIVLGAVLAGAFYLLTVYPDRRSAPYQQAMKRLRANPSATHLLGPPVAAGWWVQGEATQDSARFAIPVRGTDRGGILRAEAQQASGGWVFSHLTLTVADNATRLSLLDERRRSEQNRPRDSLAVPPRYLD